MLPIGPEGRKDVSTQQTWQFEAIEAGSDRLSLPQSSGSGSWRAPKRPWSGSRSLSVHAVHCGGDDADLKRISMFGHLCPSEG